MSILHALNWIYVASGFGVGFLVGMTGVGGGSLMTPLLILLFGVTPVTAVGTDLLYASVTKSGGSIVHAINRTIDWPLVGRLALGSVPASIMTLIGLYYFRLTGGEANAVVTKVLGSVLLLTAASLILRRMILAAYARGIGSIGETTTRRLTILTGFVLGVLVSLTSVGAGAIGVTALILLYPQMNIRRLVGSDIAHAVPLTFVAGAGHWLQGTIDTSLLVSLLAGSLPGILLGSLFVVRVPEPALRYILAAVLTIVSLRFLTQ
jgi:uncharacterized membrane protein YfcA